MLYEKSECGKQLSDGFFGWRRILAATQVDDHPGDVAQKRHGYVGRDELQQGLHDAQLDDQIAAVRPVTDDVAQRPHGLLAHVLVRRLQEAQKMLDSTYTKWIVL